MKAPILRSDNSKIVLIEPVIERDAQLGVIWLNGKPGRNTLELMGVQKKDIQKPSIEVERERIKKFIEKDNQLNWMIEFDGNVVGAVWVDLEPTDYLPCPAVHIMIGEPKARGHRVGTESIKLVVEYLKNHGFEKLYSRILITNSVARSLLLDNGFKLYREQYSDYDGVEWQNVVVNLKSN